MAAPIGNFQLELQKKSDALSNDVIDSLTEIKTEHEVFKKVVPLSSIEDIQWITTFLDNCNSAVRKSNSQATVFRNEGNKKFQRKLYTDAVDKYTEAIFLADRNTEDLALAYGNRSASLYRLGLYVECLADLTEALNCGCPRGILHKLLIRKANCLIRLQRVDEVKESLDEIRKLVSSPDIVLNNTDLIVQEVKVIEEACSNISHVCTKEVKITPPSVSYGNSETIVQASNAVCLQYTKEKGRFLVACKEIQAGDTLIVETPYAAVLLPDHYSTNCHNCFVKVKVPYPCRQCTKVKYCSPRCAAVSWQKYHHVECAYLPLLHSVGIAHLSLRIVLTAGLQFLIDFKKTTQHACAGNVRLPGLDENGQYCHNYRTVYDLLTHIEDMDGRDIFQYTLTAQLLLKILEHADWFSNTHCCTENQSDISSVCGICKSLSAELDTKLENSGTLNIPETPNCDNTVPTTDVCRQLEATSGNNLRCSGESSDLGDFTKNVGDIDKDKAETNKSLIQNCTQKDIASGGNGTDIIHDQKPSVSICSHTCNAGSETLQTSSDDGLPNTSSVMSDKLYIGGVLLRHILQLVCNAHAITDLQCSQIEEQKNVEEKTQVRIATAIYPTASLMNHSCHPTIISSFNMDTLVVRATERVDVGGEIFNCYGPHYRRMEYKERQRCLKEQYFFTCNCIPCMSGESQQDLFNCYQCPTCIGPATRSNKDVFTCTLCKKESKVDVNIVNQIEILFQNGLSLLNQNKLKAAKSVMLECYCIAKKILYKHNKQLSEITDCVGRCYAMSGEFDKAAKYVTESLDTVEVMYGVDSVEVGNELQKLSEILISAQQWQKALKVTDRACQIFELNYGKSHDIVRDLSAARSELTDVVKALCGGL